MKTIFRISEGYGDQGNLRLLGPIIHAGWGPTPEFSAACRAARRPEPQPIWGHVLIDTGSQHVAIEETVATRLGITANAATSQVFGFGGKQEARLYEALLIIQVMPVDTSLSRREEKAIAIPIRAYAVKDLAISYNGLTGPDGQLLNVIGLLGRTFLQFTKFSYDGLNGNIEVEIDESIGERRGPINV